MYRSAFIIVAAIICANTALALPGAGTEADPWRIESFADFNDFAADANYWDDYTRLEMDVNLPAMTYSGAVIGPGTNGSDRFEGVFDGNDHTITGLTIDAVGAWNDYLGLFGWVYYGTIKNLGLLGYIYSGTAVGG